MPRYHLAIDIGASSGRCIIGYLQDEKLKLEEVYRFENGMIKRDEFWVWDLNHIEREVIKGLKLCGERGFTPETVGIDTWGVDYVLLDSDDNLIGEAIAYRDGRTDQMVKLVEEIIDQGELYTKTGIQKQSFNTIYQLMHEKYLKSRFDKAASLLMIPDYLHFILTGKKVQEYTNASTTQLLNYETGDWNWTLIKRLGYPERIFCNIVGPGYDLGYLREEIADNVGFQTKVIVPATHDTASAIISVPAKEKYPLYISSGTWSLLGTVIPEKMASHETMTYNFSNEGAFDGNIRFLKNIMGLWMIQCLHKEYIEKVTVQDFMVSAMKSEYQGIIDIETSEFLNPSSMFEAVKSAALGSGEVVPLSIVDAAKLVYVSLAHAYKKSIMEIENITGKVFDELYVVGGGSKAEYLNTITSEVTGKSVIAGPVEASSIGNILIQLSATGQIDLNNESKTQILENLIIGRYNVKGIEE